MKIGILIIIFSFNLYAGIGGSGGGVSTSWENILKSDKFAVDGGQVPMSKGISVLYTPVYKTCIRNIESDPFIETTDKVYFTELDQNNKRVENFDIISKSVRDFAENPIRTYTLTVYVKNSKFQKIDERKKFSKTFEIPECHD